MFSKSLREREKRKINAQGIVKRENSTDRYYAYMSIKKDREKWRKRERNGERERKEENIFGDFF